MSFPYLYKVFDTKTGQYLPGTYQNAEIVKMMGVSVGIVSHYADTQYLLKKRYRIEKSGTRKSKDEMWAEEFDEARLNVLKFLKK